MLSVERLAKSPSGTLLLEDATSTKLDDATDMTGAGATTLGVNEGAELVTRGLAVTLNTVSALPLATIPVRGAAGISVSVTGGGGATGGTAGGAAGVIMTMGGGGGISRSSVSLTSCVAVAPLRSVATICMDVMPAFVPSRGGVPDNTSVVLSNCSQSGSACPSLSCALNCKRSPESISVNRVPSITIGVIGRPMVPEPFAALARLMGVSLLLATVSTKSVLALALA